MEQADFDFELPPESIARFPAERREDARLMVLDRARGTIEHRRFAELPELLAPGDCLVVNESRVFPARLTTHKQKSGGKVELLLTEPADTPLVWRAMATQSRTLTPGTRLVIGELSIEVLQVLGDGFVSVQLPIEAEALCAAHGELPLPPYLGRKAVPSDRERYQTVFADPTQNYSVAAPTAGLHFTPELLARIAARGVARAALRLHVGPGTFLPVRGRLEDHVMHYERYEVSAPAAATIAASDRVVAVGTTVVRTLESLPELAEARGSTDLFIKPGFQFSYVDALITNFHLPRSTLLLLVAAFAGEALIARAYREAIAEGYRFFSYGDAMVIW